jgi:hypothetical protein
MATTTAAKDAALAAVTSAGTKWVVLTTGTPASATAAAVHAVRFTGCAPVAVSGAGWSSPSGSAVRQVSNTAAVQFAPAAGLGGATSVQGFALVSTSDGQVPNAGSTFSNVNTVWFYGLLVASLSVRNADEPRFAAGTLVVEAAGT